MLVYPLENAFSSGLQSCIVRRQEEASCLTIGKEPGGSGIRALGSGSWSPSQLGWSLSLWRNRWVLVSGRSDLRNLSHTSALRPAEYLVGTPGSRLGASLPCRRRSALLTCWNPNRPLRFIGLLRGFPIFSSGVHRNWPPKAPKGANSFYWVRGGRGLPLAPVAAGILGHLSAFLPWGLVTASSCLTEDLTWTTT